MPFEVLMEHVAALSPDEQELPLGVLSERWGEPAARISDAIDALKVVRGERSYISVRAEPPGGGGGSGGRRGEAVGFGGVNTVTGSSGGGGSGGVRFSAGRPWQMPPPLPPVSEAAWRSPDEIRAMGR